MMVKTMWTQLAILALIGASVALAQTGGGYDLTWSTIDGGGTTSTGGGYELSGTVGQPDAGEMSGGTYTLTGGFWGGIGLPGDCNGDGDVDLDDFIGFEACLAGPGGGLGAGCDCFDFDGSGAVDLLDYAELQVVFGG